MPIISFIIPVFNVQKYLKFCLDSIINQFINDFEIILVDDGSTDKSPSICDEYAKKYQFVKVIHKENGGLSDARNIGILEAQGEYILFVDSDDYIEPNSINKIIKTLNEQKNVDVVFLEAFKVFPNSTKIPMGDSYVRNKIFGKTKYEVLKHLASLPKFPAAAWSKLVKRYLIIKNELFFQKGITSEDLDWSIKLFLTAEKYNYCSFPYYNYRQLRTDSISATVKPSRFKDILFVINKWIDYFDSEKNSIYKELIFSLLAYEFIFLLVGYWIFPQSEKETFKTSIKNIDWIMDFRKNNFYSLIKLLYRLTGISNTSRILNFFLKHRNLFALKN